MQTYPEVFWGNRQRKNSRNGVDMAAVASDDIKALSAHVALSVQRISALGNDSVAVIGRTAVSVLTWEMAHPTNEPITVIHRLGNCKCVGIHKISQKPGEVEIFVQDENGKTAMLRKDATQLPLFDAKGIVSVKANASFAVGVSSEGIYSSPINEGVSPAPRTVQLGESNLVVLACEGLSTTDPELALLCQVGSVIRVVRTSYGPNGTCDSTAWGAPTDSTNMRIACCSVCGRSGSAIVVLRNGPENECRFYDGKSGAWRSHRITACNAITACKVVNADTVVLAQPLAATVTSLHVLCFRDLACPLTTLPREFALIKQPSKAPSTAVYLDTDGSSVLYAAVGREIYRFDIAHAMASQTQSLAAALRSTATASGDDAYAAQVLDYICSSNDTAPDFAIRDAVVPAKSANPILLRLVEKSLSHSDLLNAVNKYIKAAKGLQWCTVLYAMEILLPDAVARRSVKPNESGLSTPTAQLQSYASDVASLLCSIDVCDLAGSVLHAASNVSEQCVGAMFEATYVLLLHALRDGKKLCHLLIRIADALVSTHSKALSARCSWALPRTVSLMNAVSQWALEEPGPLIGQLTAHCGPESTAKKEAALLPNTANRIRVDRTAVINRVFVPL